MWPFNEALRVMLNLALQAFNHLSGVFTYAVIVNRQQFVIFEVFRYKYNRWSLCFYVLNKKLMKELSGKTPKLVYPC